MRFNLVITAFPVDCAFPEVNLTGLSFRLFGVRCHSVGVFFHNDLQSVPQIWKKESPDLHLDLRECWVFDGYELQGFRNCCQIDICGE